jgi:hypothetical protein
MGNRISNEYSVTAMSGARNPQINHQRFMFRPG